MPVDGISEYAFHAALRPGEDAESWTQEDARRVFAQAFGKDLGFEVLSATTWIAGHSLVAERFGAGRIFIAGDAAHLFTPTGGLGYNTAVEDAVNLGWKLAHVVRGSRAREPALELRNRAQGGRVAQHRLCEALSPIRSGCS
jgi:2-polyprenyl-6-methoxyphenol hydroxylase-like FAD-dependent oxidoreductase